MELTTIIEQYFSLNSELQIEWSNSGLALVWHSSIPLNVFTTNIYRMDLFTIQMTESILRMFREFSLNSEKTYCIGIIPCTISN